MSSRAGDHIDRVRDGRHRAGHCRSPPASRERQRDRGEDRRPDPHHQRLRHRTRLDGSGGEQRQRQVGDRHPEPGRGATTRPGCEQGGRQGRNQPGGQAADQHRDAPIGDRGHPLRAVHDSARIDGSLRPNRLALHRAGDRQTEATQDRRREVRGEDVAVSPSRIGGEIAVEAPAGDADREGRALGRRFGDRDQQILAPQRPCEGGELPDGRRDHRKPRTAAAQAPAERSPPDEAMAIGRNQGGGE